MSQDPRIDGAITSAIDDFSVWFAENRTPFFADFTDHGVAHISNVLASAEALISDDAWGKLTSADAGYLIGASLLHDSAMHLTVDGLRNLLRETDQFGTSKLLPKDNAWADEYHNFIQEVTRWSPEKIYEVVGDYELITDPAPRLHNLQDRDRRLLGEFIRRHHARMAHEFALLGVSGAEGGGLTPFEKLSDSERDLVGFIARSHHLGIRDAADRLPQDSRSIFRGCHVPFVMAVLRIADYIQIDAERADKRLLQLRTLRSPISQLEWAKHNGIQDLHVYGGDPEALYVRAEPPSAQVFVGLRALFRDIQRELDETWALLGEVYGRVVDLRVLGIRVRRLRSNLDDVSAFVEDFQPQYVPKEIRLTTASAELLRLLVVPLYGDRPSIGVRELLQNALDACNERMVLEGARLDVFSPEISISFERRGEEIFLKVADNGCGMSIDTIQNYFLKAGASFRRSQWWRETFLEEDGSARVTRNGRFGIGALAAFLIGDRVHIRTRHYLEKSGAGLVFDLKLDGSIVEVRTEPCFVGTQVSAGPLLPSVVEALVRPKDHPAFNQWYFLNEPTINYDDSAIRNAERSLPAVNSANVKEPAWTQLLSDDFEYVGWSYSEKVKVGDEDYAYPNNYLICNGIFVSYMDRDFPHLNISSQKSPFEVMHPSLMVFDRDGVFPLNIQRTGLSAIEYPFQEALEQSISAMLAGNILDALALPPNPFYLSNANSRFHQALMNSGSWSLTRGELLFGLNSRGWFIVEEKVIKDLRIGDLAVEMVVRGDNIFALSNATAEDLAGLTFIPAQYDSASNTSFKQFLRAVLDGSMFERLGRRALSGVIVFRQNYIAGLKKNPKIPQYLLKGTGMDELKNGWALLWFGSMPNKTRLEQIRRWTKTSSGNAVVIIETVDAPLEDSGRSFLADAWIKITDGGYWRGSDLPATDDEQ